MIKLVVFDWNGVLIADATACKDTENHILKMYGRKPVTMEKFREFVSIPAKEFFIRMGFTPAFMAKHGSRMQAKFHEYYEQRIQNIRTRRNARALLKWLSQRKIECVILSNHTEEGIRDQMQRFGIEGYFSEILSNHRLTAMHRQNKRERLGSFLKRRRLKRGQVVLIGDSPEEIKIGKHFDIKTIAISGGYYATHRLKERKPDHLIHNLSQMVDIIKKS